MAKRDDDPRYTNDVEMNSFIVDEENYASSSESPASYEFSGKGPDFNPRKSNLRKNSVHNNRDSNDNNNDNNDNDEQFSDFEEDDPLTFQYFEDLYKGNSFKSRFAHARYITSKFLIRFWKGPKIPYDSPYEFKNIYLKKIDEFPYYVNCCYPSWKRLLILSIYLFVWFNAIYYNLKPFLTTDATFTKEENHEEKTRIINLSCRSARSVWKGKNSVCGLNAESCKPFDDREVIFRCPALCDRESWTYSSLTVGDQDVKYRGYFIGGGKYEKQSDKNGEQEEEDILSYPYRADSYPCGAAIHAGVISAMYGGCVKLRFTGHQNEFPSKKSYYSTIEDSIGFDSFFPSSFQFVKIPSTCTNCYDPRFSIVNINFFFGLPLIYFNYNSTIAYWISCIVGFWTIILTFDPPIIINVQDPESLPTLVSLGFRRFLPFCFIAYTIWHLCVKLTLIYPNSSICKTFVWYPLFWIGLLNNVTFDRLPVDRLTLKDIVTQPGAITATIGIISTIVICACIQAYKVWLAGKFQRYLFIYSIFIFGLIILGNLPGLNLRVHHYILALILIPGTATKGFSAMLFQGVLLGLLVNGISRWGLAAIEETSRSLRRADPTGEIKPPVFVDFNDTTNELSWKNVDKTNPKIMDGVTLAPSDKLSGFSLLINDVERYNGYNTTIDIQRLIDENKELKDEVYSAINSNDSTNKNTTNLYLRLARANVSLNSKSRSDYTKAAILAWPPRPQTVDGQQNDATGKSQVETFKFPESGVTK